MVRDGDDRSLCGGGGVLDVELVVLVQSVSGSNLKGSGAGDSTYVNFAGVALIAIGRDEGELAANAVVCEDDLGVPHVLGNEGEKSDMPYRSP